MFQRKSKLVILNRIEFESANGINNTTATKSMIQSWNLRKYLNNQKYFIYPRSLLKECCKAVLFLFSISNIIHYYCIQSNPFPRIKWSMNWQCIAISLTFILTKLKLTTKMISQKSEHCSSVHHLLICSCELVYKIFHINQKANYPNHLIMETLTEN